MPQSDLSQRLLGQTVVELIQHLEGVGHVEDVGLAVGPAAVGIEVYGAAFSDEAPWQQVARPLGWRGVEPVWPTWLRWLMNDSTACPSPC